VSARDACCVDSCSGMVSTGCERCSHSLPSMTPSLRAVSHRYRIRCAACLPPAPRDGLIVAILVFAQNNLGHHAITEHDEYEDTPELCQRFPQFPPYSTPKEIWRGRHGVVLRDFVVDDWPMFSVWTRRRECGHWHSLLGRRCFRRIFVMGKVIDPHDWSVWLLNTMEDP
jgi:hypothetical protein